MSGEGHLTIGVSGIGRILDDVLDLGGGLERQLGQLGGPDLRDADAEGRDRAQESAYTPVWAASRPDSTAAANAA